MPKSHDIGRSGEMLAADFLREHGYDILAVNWRSGKAEVDIIAAIGNSVCLVEVKTRSGIAFGKPQDFVSVRKQRLLLQAADAFVTAGNIDVDIRFDIIAVQKQENTFRIEHIKNAFSQF